MGRSQFLPGLLVTALLLPGLAFGQKPDETVLNVSHRSFTDADVARIASPEKLRVLVFRGHLGYGSNAVTDAGIAQLGRCKNLRVLSAGGLELTDRAVASIGQLTTLEELNLDSNKITGTGFQHLRSLKNLRRLNLSYNPLRADALPTLASMTTLTHLLMDYHFPVDDSVLAHCSKLENLEVLRLFKNTAAVTDRGLAHLARLKKLTNVTLRGSPHITDAGLAKLSECPHLREVALHELRSVTPRGVEILGKFTEMRSLSIESVRMDTRSVQALSPLKKLEKFLLWNVANEPLTLDALGELRSLRWFRTNQAVPSSAIRALANLDKLESIGDELTEITDEDLKHLARLPKLRTLMLGSEHVTRAALPTLAKMTALRELYVTEKVGITPEGWTLLGKASLTQCKIARFRPPYTVYHEPDPSAIPSP